MDVVDLDRRAAEGMEAIVAAIAPEQWFLPTPCAEWSVRELVGHVVAANVKFAAIARGDDWRPGPIDVELGDDPAVTYRVTVDGMLEAWRRPGARDRVIGLPGGGRGPSEVLVWIHLAETLVHGWDLAKATGQEPAFDTEAVEASLAECRSRVPPERPDQVRFRDPVAVPESASALDRLVAYLGRHVER